LARALPMLLIGAGQGGTMPGLTSAGVAGVAADDADAAGGLVNVAHQLGGCLGLPILVTDFAATGSDDLEGNELLAHQLSAAITAGATLISLAFMVVAILIWPGLRRDRTRGVTPHIGADLLVAARRGRSRLRDVGDRSGPPTPGGC